MALSPPLPDFSSIPPRKPKLENLSKRERDNRKQAALKTRLTQRLVDDLCAAIRSGAPLELCYAHAGISRQQVAFWSRLAAEAEGKKWNDRSQLERRCVAMKRAVRQAEGEAGLRIHGTIAQAAGLTRERPKQTETKVKIIGGTVKPDGTIEGGRVVESHITTKELAPDWHAAQTLGKNRFPDAFGAPVIELVDESPGGPEITGQFVYDLLQRTKQARAAAGVDDSDVLGPGVIEATASSEATEPEISQVSAPVVEVEDTDDESR
jgi:hypothetical protein